MADRCCERDPTDGGHTPDCPRILLHEAERQRDEALASLRRCLDYMWNFGFDIDFMRQAESLLAGPEWVKIS